MIVLMSDSALVNVNNTLKFIPESRAAHHRFPIIYVDWSTQVYFYTQWTLIDIRTQLYNNIDFQWLRKQLGSVLLENTV